MNTIQIKNKQAQETAQEILNMILEFYEDKDYSDTEEFVNQIIGNIESEFLFTR